MQKSLNKKKANPGKIPPPLRTVIAGKRGERAMASLIIALCSVGSASYYPELAALHKRPARGWTGVKTRLGERKEGAAGATPWCHLTGLLRGGRQDGGSCPAVGTHLLLQTCLRAGYGKGWGKEFK